MGVFGNLFREKGVKTINTSKIKPSIPAFIKRSLVELVALQSILFIIINKFHGFRIEPGESLRGTQP